jgi:hypothetical protein
MPIMKKAYAAFKPFVRPRPRPVKPERPKPSESFPEVPTVGGGNRHYQGQRRTPPEYKY